MKWCLPNWFRNAMLYLINPFSMALWRYRWDTQKLRKKG